MKINIPKNSEASVKSTDYFLLIDNSGSIWNSVSALKETVKAVVENMHETDTITVATFSSHNDFDFFVRGLKKSQNILALVNTKISSRGMTNFNDSLGELNTRIFDDVKLTSGNTNSVFYFLSDGYANHYNNESDTLKLCKALSTKFSSKTVVGYGSNYNRRLLLDMTESLNGVFNHISDYTQLKQSGETLVKSKKTTKVVQLEKCYDVIWQVTDSEIIPLVRKDKTVEVQETDKEGELFAIDYDELDNLPAEQLTDGKFVYSLAYILSQKTKASLGVKVLRTAGDLPNSKMLQKSFTVAQKGNAENKLKDLALVGGVITKSEVGNTVSLESFVKSIKDNLGKVAINLAYSPYKAVTRAGTDASKVVFKTIDTHAKIVGITGNEDRANISFLTVRNGNLEGINDLDLAQRVEDYNKTATNPITFPIEAPTFRNYMFVANGDFNYDTISLEFDDPSNGGGYTIKPAEAIDLFDENQKTVSIKDFASVYKTLIAEKAHASVLRFYIKANSKQKNLVDLRVQNYGEEGAKLLDEMGLDSLMRFKPKSEYKPKDENADFVPFLELTAQLKGAATISASKSYEKFEKKGKPNVGDNICWPLFEKYNEMLKSLGTETFVEYCQKTLEGIEDTVDLLSQKVSSMKFFLIITNSWFSDVEKSDSFEYDGLVINTKETKEYL
jgi:hypothetical protein